MLSLSIKVEPRSSKSGIVGPYGNALKVKLTSPPVEGKANKELISTWKAEAKRDRHLYKKIAVIGLTGLTATFLWAINTFSGTGARPFHGEITAKDWLAAE